MEQKYVSHQENLALAAQYLKETLPSIPKTALILGTGLNPLATRLTHPVAVAYKDIPGFVLSTVHGHEGRLVHGELDGCTVLVMQGRFHCYEGYDILDTVFPVRVFAKLGIKNLFVSNAAGGINTAFGDGALMLIKDHIAFLCDSPLKGPNMETLGARFPDMTYAYTPSFFDIARSAAKETGVALSEGIYAYAKGPQYETPAEIRALAVMGADAVGMSTVGEVIAARHCGMNVIGISCITNMAAGIFDKPLCHEEVIETSNRVSENFCRLTSAIINQLP